MEGILNNKHRGPKRCTISAEHKNTVIYLCSSVFLSRFGSDLNQIRRVYYGLSIRPSLGDALSFPFSPRFPLPEKPDTHATSIKFPLLLIQVPLPLTNSYHYPRGRRENNRTTLMKHMLTSIKSLPVKSSVVTDLKKAASKNNPKLSRKTGVQTNKSYIT